MVNSVFSFAMKSNLAALPLLALQLLVEPTAALKRTEIATALAAPERSYPVTRIVNLLKDMQEQLQKEADADSDVYEKMACWCETNDKAKTKAIADAEAKLSQLESTIEKSIALKETIGIEIDGLSKEINE